MLVPRSCLEALQHLTSTTAPDGTILPLVAAVVVALTIIQYLFLSGRMNSKVVVLLAVVATVWLLIRLLLLVHSGRAYLCYNLYVILYVQYYACYTYTYTCA